MIGLLSFHTALNYGAKLQCYALQRILEINQYDCEYINYENEGRKNNYNMFFLSVSAFKSGQIKEGFKVICGVPFISLRRKAFNSFDREYMKISSTYINDKGILKNQTPKYNKIIVGSDQVWNCKNNSNDMAYLLDFCEESYKKISYASSFGMSDIPENLKSEYKKWILDIRFLSTREDVGVDIIKRLTGRDVFLALDPVFLLKKNEWLKIVKNNEREHNFIFAYLNRKNQYADFKKISHFDDKHYKIHLLTRYLRPVDFINPHIKVKYTMSPCDFIENIYRANLVITASFHCIALSVVLNKPFIAILVGDEGKDARVLSLLKSLKLENHILRSGLSIEDDILNFSYTETNKLLDELRTNSLSFLFESLESKNE